MAQSRKTAPSILDAVKKLKQGKILPLYYFFGEDTYSLSISTKAIEAAVSPLITSDFDKDICYSDDRNLQDVINAARSFPFGSQKKLIILKEAEKVKDKKLLEAYITSPPDFTVLVLVHNGTITNLTSSPFNLLLENNFLYEAKELKGENLIDWVIESVRSKERQISNENAMLLADVSGENRAIIENQLEKIITFLGDKIEITFNSIKDVSTSFKEYNIFDLQNAVFQKDKAASLKIALNLLEKGQEATFIINMLTRAFIGLSQMKEIKEKKLSDFETARIVGSHHFYVKNYQRAEMLFSNNDLIKAAEALLKADIAIKTTSVDHKTVITLLIAEIF
jgi:DNA polymerase III subunit delta